MDEVECIVVGAGVIGLAIARRLARDGREVVVLDSENAIGQHTSSHNSGVIHAGIYYRHDSLQHRLCVAGKDMLYDYCATRHVDHARCGKLIVATREDQLAELERLRLHGLKNGVNDLVTLSVDEVAAREPAVACVGAVSSPSTGIIDAPALMLSLLGEAEDAGAELALNAPFISARPDGGLWRVSVGGDSPMDLSCRVLINAAGHGAWGVAQGITGFDHAFIPPRYMAKGSYFALQGAANPFRQLIYPMPDAGSLGLHVVLDLGGGVKFGPDMDWMDVGPMDYSVDAAKTAKFETAVRDYWPALPDGCLVPESAGIRPRIWGPDGSKTDFQIEGPQTHGMNGLINLFGMESPGLTSCLAIAKHVGETLIKGETQ